MLGFPIRKSSDQRSVDSSPRHIAASHVLHRLSMPRHPPCALKHLLTHKNQKEITHFDERISHKGLRVHLDARNHYPILKHHTPPPRWRDSTRIDRVLFQGPIVCLAIICCCAPGFRPLQTRTPHGIAPHQLECFSWCSLERR